MSAHARARCRSWTGRALRAAVRHPYRTFRYADEELTQRTGFGVLQAAALVGFVLITSGWVAAQVGPVLLAY